MAVPNITWYVAPDGSCKVFMHEGLTIRSFDSPNVATAERTIASVCIDAFGMDQPDALTFAESAVADQVKAAALPQTLSDHIALLQEQLGETQGQHDKAVSDLTAAKSTIATSETEIADLKTELSAARAQKSLPDTPSTTSEAGSGTESPPKFTSSEIGHG